MYSKKFVYFLKIKTKNKLIKEIITLNVIISLNLLFYLNSHR